MKCPFCGAPAQLQNPDEPTAYQWVEADEEWVSLHEYACLLDGDHTFYLDSCPQG